MAGEAFLFKQYSCFIVFIFDLHMYCDDMLIMSKTGSDCYCRGDGHL